MQKKCSILLFFVFISEILFCRSNMANEIVQPIQSLKIDIQSTLQKSCNALNTIKKSINNSAANKVNHNEHQSITISPVHWDAKWLKDAFPNTINHDAPKYYEHKCLFWPRLHHFANGIFYTTIAFSGLAIYFGYKNQSDPIPWQNIGLITCLLATPAALYEWQKVAFPSVKQALNLQKLKESISK